MMISLAWRNIWRSPTRSLVVVVSVALGLWAGLAMVSFSLGMGDQRARDQIETMVSHLQIHAPGFTMEREARAYLPDGAAILDRSRQQAGVVSATGRTLSTGMISSPRKSSGVMINGVDPAHEALVTRLQSKVQEGDYLDAETRSNPILVSARTAELLGLELRKKVVLTIQNVDGDMVATAFRVVGIYKTIDAKYDEAHVFVRAEDLQQILGIEGQLHEIAIMATGKDAVAPIQQELAAAFPEVLVQDWMERSPELRMMAESMDSVMWIFVGIIVLALSFGIINTMLMAVLERTHELGMLMAVGMNKVRVFSLIMTETFFLSMIGAPLGLLLSWATVAYLGHPTNGIDMSVFSEGMAQLGMASTVYPYLDPNYYWQVLLIVAFAAFVSAIYPALKALSLKPVEAIRSL